MQHVTSIPTHGQQRLLKGQYQTSWNSASGVTNKPIHKSARELLNIRVGTVIGLVVGVVISLVKYVPE